MKKIIDNDLGSTLKEFRKSGHSYMNISRLTGLGYRTVYRYLNERCRLNDLKIQRAYYDRNNKKIIKYTKEYRVKNFERIRLYQKARTQRKRLMVLNHYSNNSPKCACCCETIIQFLSIDHVDNNGKSHRRLIGGSSQLVSWLIKNNYPKGFQILCFNCNLSKGFYGKCPHQLVKDSDVKDFKHRLQEGIVQ